MRKRLLSILLALALCSAVLPSGALAAETGTADPEGAVSFENLEDRLRQNNVNILALEETIASLESLDYDKMKEDLRDALNQIARAQRGMMMLSNLDVSNPYYTSLDTYSFNQLGQSYDSLSDTFEDLKDGKLQEDNEGVVRQLKNAQDQIVVMGQNLYIALLDMQDTRGTLQRKLDALDRSMAEMELRYQRGQISSLQLSQVKNGRAQVKSGLDTLDRNIGVYTVQLQSMLNLEETGKLTLSPLPQAPADLLASMNYEKDLAAAREASYTLYDAAETLKDAKEDYADTAREYGFNENRYQYVSAQHTYRAAQYTYEAAQKSFTLSFLTTYSAVGDYKQVLEAARSALKVEQDSYAASELKYRQGNLSKNALLDAEDTLREAEATVRGAEHDLYAACLAYQWAVERGLMN